MALVQRPAKQGGSTTYQTKVAQGYTKILASEVDADLDTIYAAWNGGADTVNLADNAVTSAKIGVGQVGTRELANLGVATGDLADGAITTPKLAAAPNGVATGNVNDLAITTPKLALAPNGVATATINDGAVTTAKLAAGAASGQFVGARQFAFQEFGRNTNQIFALFVEPKTTAQGGLLAGQVCHIVLGGTIAVQSGNLFLGLNVGPTQVAVLCGALSAFIGVFRVEILVGAVDPQNVSVNTLWHCWSQLTNTTTATGPTPLEERGNFHGVGSVGAGGVRVNGVYGASNSGNAVQLVYAMSELL